MFESSNQVEEKIANLSEEVLSVQREVKKMKSEDQIVYEKQRQKSQIDDKIKRDNYFCFDEKSFEQIVRALERQVESLLSEKLSLSQSQDKYKVQIYSLKNKNKKLEETNETLSVKLQSVKNNNNTNVMLLKERSQLADNYEKQTNSLKEQVEELNEKLLLHQKTEKELMEIFAKISQSFHRNFHKKIAFDKKNWSDYVDYIDKKFADLHEHRQLRRKFQQIGRQHQNQSEQSLRKLKTLIKSYTDGVQIEALIKNMEKSMKIEKDLMDLSNQLKKEKKKFEEVLKKTEQKQVFQYAQKSQSIFSNYFNKMCLHVNEIIQEKSAFMKKERKLAQQVHCLEKKIEKVNIQCQKTLKEQTESHNAEIKFFQKNKQQQILDLKENMNILIKTKVNEIDQRYSEVKLENKKLQNRVNQFSNKIPQYQKKVQHMEEKRKQEIKNLKVALSEEIEKKEKKLEQIYSVSVEKVKDNEQKVKQLSSDIQELKQRLLKKVVSLQKQCQEAHNKIRQLEEKNKINKEQILSLKISQRKNSQKIRGLEIENLKQKKLSQDIEQGVKKFQDKLNETFKITLGVDLNFSQVERKESLLKLQSILVAKKRETYLRESEIFNSFEEKYKKYVIDEIESFVSKKVKNSKTLMELNESSTEINWSTVIKQSCVMMLMRMKNQSYICSFSMDPYINDVPSSGGMIISVTNMKKFGMKKQNNLVKFDGSKPIFGSNDLVIYPKGQLTSIAGKAFSAIQIEGDTAQARGRVLLGEYNSEAKYHYETLEFHKIMFD